MAIYMSMVGNKVYLNPKHEDDIPILANHMNEDRIKIFGRNSGTAVYEKNMKERFGKKENEESYTIFRKDNDCIIGDVAIHFIDTYNRSGMLGIAIYGDENRGKGYGKEAILLMLRHAFIDMNFESIYLGTWEYNKPAVHLYEKIGFKVIGRKRHSRILGNKYYDEIMMDMISEEYFKMYGNEEIRKYGI